MEAVSAVNFICSTLSAKPQNIAVDTNIIIAYYDKSHDRHDEVSGIIDQIFKMIGQCGYGIYFFQPTQLEYYQSIFST